MSTLSTARSARSARRGLLTPGVLAAVLLGAVPLLSACGTGKNAPTRMEYAVADGVQAAAGNVVLRNLQLVADTGETQGGATTLELTGVIANNTGRSDRLTGIIAESGGAQVPFGMASAGGSSSAATSSSAGTSRSASPSAAASSAAAPSASASGSASASAQPSASASAQPSASAAASSSSSPSSSSSAAAASPVSLPVEPGAPLVLGEQGKQVQVDLTKPVLPGDVVSLTFSFDQSGSTTVAVPVYSLASRGEGSPQSPVTYPKPDLPEGFNQGPYDLASAAPSS